jgi:hypothetical protein
MQDDTEANESKRRAVEIGQKAARGSSEHQESCGSKVA